MRVNVDKSKVVHFRLRTQEKSSFNFKCGEKIVDIVERYKYLGLVFDEFLDFNVTAGTLADSAGRALGAIYSKFKILKGLGYKTYTKMYETGVVPILDYCSGVWGFNRSSKADGIQNRAIRWFLGVHKFAANLAVNGDMGWIMSETRQNTAMLRLWNRFVKMDNTRLAKKVFLWDRKYKNNNWNSNIMKILQATNMTTNYNNIMTVNLASCRQTLHEKKMTEWRNEINLVPKLRNYCIYKNEYKAELYVQAIHDRQERSLMAKFRTGVLPLSIETGRFQNIPIEYRLCLLCEDNVCESESHFLLHCKFYNDLRSTLLLKVQVEFPLFVYIEDEPKMNILMSDNYIKETAKYIHKAFHKRRENLYV